MKISQKNLKKLLNKKLEVVWSDITSNMAEDKDKIDRIKDIDQLLTICNSYGIIYRYSKKCILLLSEDSKVACDYTIIPISNIDKINILKGGNN